jgi:hypothetical protein
MAGLAVKILDRFCFAVPAISNQRMHLFIGYSKVSIFWVGTEISPSGNMLLSSPLSFHL